MTVVSSKEFVTNQKKYFDLALYEQVCIKKGRNVFHLTGITVDEQGKKSKISRFKTALQETKTISTDIMRNGITRYKTLDDLLNED